VIPPWDGRAFSLGVPFAREFSRANARASSVLSRGPLPLVPGFALQIGIVSDEHFYLCQTCRCFSLVLVAEFNFREFHFADLGSSDG
jgi:hypothetical protein